MMPTLRALGCVVALLAAGIPPAAGQTRGGTLTVGAELDITGFDPLKVGVFDTASSIAADLLFDTLTRLDEDGNPQPRLALSWSHSDDFKTWTFNLRPGVTFHDGTPYNAQAVAWNYARMQDPNSHCACAFYIAAIDHVEARDELTAVFHLRYPAVNAPASLSVPAAVNVVQSPAAMAALGPDYTRHPVGTGPFVLKSWTAGDRLVLERNPDYWNKGHPFLDRVVLKPLPDGQTCFASLLSGETDVVWADEYEADHIARARQDPSLSVLSYVGAGAAVAAFNTKLAPFDDVRVRRALVMALDRKKLSLALTNGLARPASNPYGDGSWIKCQDDGALPTDPEKARPHQGVRQAGRIQDAVHRHAARPRRRSGAAADVEGSRRQNGDGGGGPSDDRAARLPPAVPTHALAHRRQSRPQRRDLRQLPLRQPGGARQLGGPRTRPTGRAHALDGRPGPAHRGLLRHQPAGQQGGDLVLDLPEHLLRPHQGAREGHPEALQWHHQRGRRLARVVHRSPSGERKAVRRMVASDKDRSFSEEEAAE
jgi:peptide/nickel transport system substrate-binding protein